uniref:Dynein assembly factor 1, axonemal homolog n=1 Tax=Ciona savignyi TaxID=51511 RepID=H2YGI6_CIOSA
IEEFSEEKQESILKELCISNGIQYSQLEGNGPNVKEIEMFFSGYPYMAGLKHFVHLTTLVLVGQSITLIQNLHHCLELRELWVCECELTKIQGLEKLKRLSKLLLYGNKLEKIENITHLHNLDVLNLSRNNIKVIEGMDGLKWLKELQLGGNSIEVIGTSLQNLQQLEILNLSGNRISSFKDLTNLTKLPKLKDISLKDALYPNNPVCLLCNYSTHILYHLPNLERLDTFDVSSAQLRELAETTVLKKKMYYKMRVKTVHRNLTSLLNRLIKEKRILLQIPEERLRSIQFALKSV